ncbi:teneurin-m [Galendromus occidentalis]|uniref:Teneurin-m n=1 Tax=Galendromus occidentalis TaxID=34638 RepID=A0AAJ7WJ53_9ACAR|nr:teneurin-m [Galendromus occidentalis]
MAEHGLEWCPTGFTRKGKCGTGTIIDHVLLRNHSLDGYEVCCTDSMGMSDHEILKIRLFRQATPTPAMRTNRSPVKIDWDIFCEELARVDIEAMMGEDDPDSFLDRLYEVIDSKKIQNFNKYRNRLRELLREAERRHFEKALRDSGDPKTSWRIINQHIRGKSKARVYPSFLKGADIDINRMNAANTFFAETGERTAAEIGPSRGVPDPHMQDIDVPLHEFMAPSPAEIEEIIGRLANGRSPGRDGITSRMLKSNRSFFVPILQHLCACIFQTRKYPERFKEAEVILIHKGGGTEDLHNYRPISLLSTLSKVVEHCVVDQLTRHLERNHLLSDRQYGFRRGRGTNHAVLDLHSSIIESIDSRLTPVVFFADYSKAFDCLPHQAFINKLDRLGVTGHALEVISSYFDSRSQRLRCGEHHSEPAPLLSGAPQGGVFAPLAFIIYINDLLLKMNDDRITSIGYADDTCFLINFQSGIDFLEIERAATRVRQWSSANGLLLNAKKCNYMIFGNQLGKPDRGIMIHSSCPHDQTCSCPVISCARETRYLGITIDDGLSWKPHIANLVKKLRPIVASLAKLGRSSSRGDFTVASRRAYYPQSRFSGDGSDDLTDDGSNIYEQANPPANWVGQRYASLNQAASHRKNNALSGSSGTNSDDDGTYANESELTALSSTGSNNNQTAAAMLQQHNVRNGPPAPPRNLTMNSHTGSRQLMASPSDSPHYETARSPTAPAYYYSPNEIKSNTLGGGKQNGLGVDLRSSTSHIYHDETKTNPDGYAFGYTGTITSTVPVRAVQSNARAYHTLNALNAQHGIQAANSQFQQSRNFRKAIESRCSWKCVAVVFIVIALALLTTTAYFIFTMSTARSQHAPLVVMDLPPELDTRPDLKNPETLPTKTVPPISESFAELAMGRRHTNTIYAYGHWNVQFQQNEAALVKFNYSLPSTASIAVYGRRNSVPTHTRYDFFEILNARSSGIRTRKAATSHEMVSIEFIHFLDRGRWFVSIYNDGDQQEEVSFVSLVADVSSLPCAYDCHGHGTCTMGKCNCDPNYTGESCAYQLCPVLCNGRGNYVNGECQCQSGWKGKECQLREEECEVADCSGHGDCLDGFCKCFPGYKGSACEEVDCIDPDCSGHGVCLNGQCLCKKGWKSIDCSEADQEALRCLPDCSNHGHFDIDKQRCVCDDPWSGPDCSQERCGLDCGERGRCREGRCECLDGWTGPKCDQKLCDSRCSEHGQCRNGTCACLTGWNGKHCTLEGCPSMCNRHGECIKDAGEWVCRCHDNWSGTGCSLPSERNCGDKIDNDGDGLLDCADSECCTSPECSSNPLCFQSSDPRDVLLRKQPPAVTASFFQRMQFLIEDDSVQSYASKGAFNHSTLWNHFNTSRASVIRGQVVSTSGSPLMGVRVGIASDSAAGFTVSRLDGWFDLMVNGGGAVTLQFRRDPFKVHERTLTVPVNDIMVLGQVIMSLTEMKIPDITKLAVCADHDFDLMKPVVMATWKHGFQGGCSDNSAILAESQAVQEAINIPGTKVHLLYHSSRSAGYYSTIQLKLTPDTIPQSLRLIHLKIYIEGVIFERTFEADPAIQFTYAWNRRNTYRQKVYGIAQAHVHVGYEYSNCPEVLWEIQTTQVSGHDMSISEIGGWNLDIHHRYNFHEGILQKGDGSNVYLKNKPKVLSITMGDESQRPLHCTYCNGVAKDQKLMSPVAVVNAPDGSIIVGDFNLIRRIKPDGMVSTVVELASSQIAYSYHLAVAPATGQLYVSDPERHKVFRVIRLDDVVDVKNNVELVVGTGAKCLPGDKLFCGDGRPAREAKLSYPKGIAISMNNEIYIADGTNIRYVDRLGVMNTIIGDHHHKSHWKPLPCTGTYTASQVNLKWPTELAINPLDNSLHILDDHVIMKLTPDRRLKVVAGKPLHCTGTKGDFATDVFLESPTAITFSSQGDLYIAESDSQTVNRVRVVTPDGKIKHYVGAEPKCSCLEINCKCYDNEILATAAKFDSISGIAVTPDGNLHISDKGNHMIRSVISSLPAASGPQHVIEIFSPETQEIYTFNRHGQHISTRNILTGQTKYTFTYNVNTSNGKLSTVTDASGNKLFVLRDTSHQAKSIENSQGGKCLIEIGSRHSMLLSFVTADNHKTSLEYYGSNSGLLKSKTDSSGKSVLYSYDHYGRLTDAVTPTGEQVHLSYSLSIKGATVVVTRNGRETTELLIKGHSVTSKSGASEELTCQLNPDNGVVIASDTNVIRDIETQSSPLLMDQDVVSGEIFPVPSRLRLSLSDDITQRLEWRYYSKPENRKKITQIGRRAKINGENLFSIEFDRQSFTESILDKNNIVLLTVQYNQKGQPESWNPKMNVSGVTLDYDRFGRVTKWQRGDLIETYSFDLAGRLTDVRHADNTGIIYKYTDGPITVPTEVILPSGSRYQLMYNGHSSLQSIITPNGHRHEIASQTSLGFYKLLYLPPGANHPYVMHYDERGYVLAKFYPHSLGRVMYSYNDEGRLDTIICGQESTNFYYNNNSALVRSVAKNVPLLETRIDYRHHGSLLKEERFRFNSKSLLDGIKLKYIYDGGRLSSSDIEIIGKTTFQSKYRYSVVTGLLEQTHQFTINRPRKNSIIIHDDNRQFTKTIQLDSLGRIESLTLSLWSKEIFSYVPRYNNKNLVSSLQTKVGRDTNVLETRFNYTLDGFLQLVEPVSTTAQTWKYSYDINGNLESIQEGPKQVNLNYDSGDRVISYGGIDVYKADARGFITRRGEEYFEYNAEAQLVHAWQTRSYDIHFFYDSRNRLIATKNHRGNITQFVYADPIHPDRVTQMHQPKESLTTTFVYDTLGHLMFIQRRDNKFYVACDHLGSPLAVFSPENSVVKEIQRNPFGRVTYDSNPDFYLPIDFLGGIRDPVTQLVFYGARPYDNLGIQWLTPNWEDVYTRVEQPHLIHLYRFRNNDPINVKTQPEKMTTLNEWMVALGYDLSKIVIQPPQIVTTPIVTPLASSLMRPTLPVLSGLNCLATEVSNEFNRVSAVPETKVKNLGLFERPINSRIANLPGIFGDGLLINRLPDGSVRVFVLPEATPILRDVITAVFNNSLMLDVHYNQHGLDYFYFVQPQLAKADKDWEQLGRLGSALFNITKHPVVDSEGGRRAQIDIRVHSSNVALNIKYGSTVPEEKQRIVNHVKRKAIQEAWELEAGRVATGHKGSTHDWSHAEREELLATKKIDRYYPTDIHTVDEYPQLADDPTNIVFRKEGTRKRRARYRNMRNQHRGDASKRSR